MDDGSAMSFRFNTPPQLPPGSKPVTAEQAEEFLLNQLKSKERPEEDVLRDLAALYCRTNRHSEALVLVRKLADKTESLEKKAGYYLAMGGASEQMKDFVGAIKYYTQALSLEPINCDTWYFINNNLGFCLNHFGRYAEGEPYCRRAIEINPLRHNAHKNLGISLEGQGDFVAAAECYILAVQNNASDARALKHLEELVAKQPTVAIDVTDFDMKLEACKMAVEQAATVRRKAMDEWNQWANNAGKSA